MKIHMLKVKCPFLRKFTMPFFISGGNSIIRLLLAWNRNIFTAMTVFVEQSTI